MKHAASVRPEPGSNSPLSESLFDRHISMTLDSFRLQTFVCAVLIIFFELTKLFVFSYSVFNVLSLTFILILLFTKSFFGVLASLAISFPTAIFILLLKFFLSTTFLKFVKNLFFSLSFKVRCALSTSLIVDKRNLKINIFFFVFYKKFYTFREKAYK